MTEHDDIAGYDIAQGEKSASVAQAVDTAANVADVDVTRGLTDEQVAERVERGLQNVNTDLKTRTVGQIMRDHAFTLFNAVNIALALLVAITGEYRNMLFMGVVVTNFVIGVFQEVRAKRKVDELTILVAKRVRVVRGEEEREVAAEELVVDDIIQLSHGDQVPCDARVVTGGAYLNESLLTGESDAIAKRPGDELLSGSFVESGSVYAQVTRVGAEAYAGRISAEAKYVKPVASKMRDALSLIIMLGTYALVPLGLGLFVRTVHSGEAVNDAILTTVAAVVGMIPQGLVLLTSTVFAIATTRLASRKVLVQQPYCVETLARVDVLCLDKTGTITSGQMEVSSVRGLGETGAEKVLSAAAAVVRASRDDANETAFAIMAHAQREGVPEQQTARAVSFSSARKYSGCVLADGTAYVMGAAQYVLGKDAAASIEGELRSFGLLERVLVVCEVDGYDDADAIQGTPCLLGLVALRDQIRPSAAQTVAYFEEQGVSLRVISGDDPATVGAIAQQVGIAGAHAVVDASALDDEALAAKVDEAVVFGRVTPDQKRVLVHALQAAGHTVAMTGDGVNDVLALKDADCSVSMSSGSAAARNVSEVVLADNDFAHMPEVVAEGRRSINNLQRSASLFLVKTVFSAVLALICIVAPPYPFIPIQMTLISFAVIGMPSFVLALEPNHDRISGDFLANVLARSLPASLSVVLALLVVIVARNPLGLTFAQASTTCMVLTLVVGTALIVKISVPLTPLRCALLVAVVAVGAGGCILFPSLFKVATPTTHMVLLAVVAGVAAVLLFVRLFDACVYDVRHDGRLSRAVRRLEEHNVQRGI